LSFEQNMFKRFKLSGRLRREDNKRKGKKGSVG
jgi:hypothetical protein